MGPNNIYLGHQYTGKDRSEFTYITGTENVPASNFLYYCDMKCEVRERIPNSYDLEAHGRLWLIIFENCSHV